MKSSIISMQTQESAVSLQGNKLTFTAGRVGISISAIPFGRFTKICSKHPERVKLVRTFTGWEGTIDSPEIAENEEDLTEIEIRGVATDIGITTNRITDFYRRDEQLGKGTKERYYLVIGRC